MWPRDGDVLVSKEPARVEREVRIWPETGGLVCPNHDSAVTRAHEMAKQRQVDAWLTEDHVHFMKIASHRPDGTA